MWVCILVQVTKEEAERRIEDIGEHYKKEILSDIVTKAPEAPITIYHIGEREQEDHWWDLCAGPHVASTGKIRPDAFDLETLAGENWQMLQVPDAAMSGFV